ncbi:MAG: XisH family protein [Cyanobacteriota bacterium]|nr:XisH family protein [Cyanobacteriota bacterium]
MPAKDIYHECVKKALIKDGWAITDDPLSIKIGKKDIFIDLAAEKLLVAEKEGRKIAVEVKSFAGKSEIEELKKALGSYYLYYKSLDYIGSERELYIAIRQRVFERLFAIEIGQMLLADKSLKLMIFNAEKEAIAQWIN